MCVTHDPPGERTLTQGKAVNPDVLQEAKGLSWMREEKPGEIGHCQKPRKDHEVPGPGDVGRSETGGPTSTNVHPEPWIKAVSQERTDRRRESQVSGERVSEGAWVAGSRD